MESQHTSIQIAVATHKPYAMPQSECYLPLHVGAELHPDVCNDMQQDNVGENISVKKCLLFRINWALLDVEK